mmetsp:Transcript_111896/g.222402  ORF Transcript_111896/g.222402 Transcript_111896/m.222402 type:complete len:260 (+) Transcript_111896:293-1072(+)
MMDSGHTAASFENVSLSKLKNFRQGCRAKMVTTMSRTATQANFVHCVRPPCTFAWKLKTGVSGPLSSWIVSRTSSIFTTQLITTLRSFGPPLKTTSRALASPVIWRLQADAMPVRGHLRSANCHSLKVTLWARSATSRSLQYLSANFWVISMVLLYHTSCPHQCSSAAVHRSNGLLLTSLSQPARMAPSSSRWPIWALHGKSCGRFWDLQLCLVKTRCRSLTSSVFSGPFTNWNCQRRLSGIPSSPSCSRILVSMTFAL